MRNRRPGRRSFSAASRCDTSRYVDPSVDPPGACSERCPGYLDGALTRVEGQPRYFRGDPRPNVGYGKKVRHPLKFQLYTSPFQKTNSRLLEKAFASEKHAFQDIYRACLFQFTHVVPRDASGEFVSSWRAAYLAAWFAIRPPRPICRSATFS